MAKQKLTIALVRDAKPKAKPYEIRDAEQGGLILRVQPKTGKRTYIAQLSRDTRRTIGDAAVVTLAQARITVQTWLAEKATEKLPPAARGKSRSPTLRDFVADTYAPWCLANKRAGADTVANIRAQFDGLLGKRLDAITAQEIEQYKIERINAGVKAATINRHLTRLRGCLTKAVLWEKLRKHPMAKVADADDDSDDRVRFLDADEEARLRGALKAREAEMRRARISGNAWAKERGEETRHEWSDEEFCDYLTPITLLALNTGLRRGELFGLKWKAIDLEDTKQLTVTAVTAKSKKTRHVALSAEALDVLKRWRKQNPDDVLVFPSPSGARLTSIKKSWARLMKLAEISDYRFHDCRHHFASMLVQRGVDLYLVMQLLGHGSVNITKKYAHVTKGQLADAVAKLGSAK
jgi:integrase